MSEHRVQRRSLPVGRFIVLLLLFVIVVMAVFRFVDWLGDVAALVVIVCASVALALLAWFRQD